MEKYAQKRTLSAQDERSKNNQAKSQPSPVCERLLHRLQHAICKYDQYSQEHVDLGAQQKVASLNLDDLNIELAGLNIDELGLIAAYLSHDASSICQIMRPVDIPPELSPAEEDSRNIFALKAKLNAAQNMGLSDLKQHERSLLNMEIIQLQEALREPCYSLLTGEFVDEGAYSCCVCAATIFLPSKAKLRACQKCGGTSFVNSDDDPSGVDR